MREWRTNLYRHYFLLISSNLWQRIHLSKKLPSVWNVFVLNKGRGRFTKKCTLLEFARIRVFGRRAFFPSVAYAHYPAELESQLRTVFAIHRNNFTREVTEPERNYDCSPEMRPAWSQFCNNSPHIILSNRFLHGNGARGALFRSHKRAEKSIVRDIISSGEPSSEKETLGRERLKYIHI
jgi:hypothetical protein